MKAKMWNKKFWVGETDPERLKKYYGRKLEQSNLIILGFVEYNFQPQGYTALWLLAESHLAIHTFPEVNKTYIELSFCVEEKFNKFVESL